MKRGWLVAGCLVLLLIGFVATPTAGQKAKKKDQSQGQAQSGSAGTSLRLPDNEAIDIAISKMLAAWQIGDVQILHSFYADDVTVVSGVWEPPIMGWANFLRAYQNQRQRMTSPRLDRSNTFINVQGNFAWVTYQWEFSAFVDGKPSSAHGQTTLVLEKRQDRWLIVHNHTSLVPETKESAPPPSPGPAKPPA